MHIHTVCTTKTKQKYGTETTTLHYTTKKKGKKTISHYTSKFVSMLCDDCTSCTVYLPSWCSPPGIQFEIRKTERTRLQGKKNILSIFLPAQNGFFCAVMVQLSNSHTFHSTESHILTAYCTIIYSYTGVKWMSWSFFYHLEPNHILQIFVRQFRVKGG